MLLHVSRAQDLPSASSAEARSADGRNGATGPPEPERPPHTEPHAGPPQPALDIDRLTAELARLAAALEREHERAAHREAVIDRLHADVQTLRRGELQTLFEPVRAVLYRLHDLTRREARRWADDPPEPRHAAALLATVADEIAEALARTGVERFTARPGDPFDPARHRPVAVETVEDPALEGAVISVCSDGFERADRVVRKAEVRIGRPPTPDRDDPADSAPHPRSDRPTGE